MALDPVEVQAWVTLAQTLVPAGITTVTEVVDMVRNARRNTLGIGDLDAICKAIIADATIREARAKAIAEDDMA